MAEFQLGKVAKVLGVGINTLMDHVKKYGVSDAKPMTKVTEEVYNKLLGDFQQDVAAKKRAEDMQKESEQMKQQREDAAKKQEIAKLQTPKPVVTEQPVVSPSIVVAPELPQTESVAPPATHLPEMKVVDKPKTSAPEIMAVDTDNTLNENGKGLKILGKIDLVAEAQKEKQRKEEIRLRQEAEKKNRREAERKAKIEADNKKRNPPVQQSRPVEQPRPVVVREPEPIKEVKADVVPDLAIEPEMHRGETPTLRGLKVMGKIELGDQSADKRKRKKKRSGSLAPLDGKPAVAPIGNKPVVKALDGTLAASDADKKKRKRKRKKVGEGNAPDNRATGNNNTTGNNNNRGGTGKQEPAKELTSRQVDDKVRATMARVQGQGKKKKFGTDRKARDERRDVQRQNEENEEEVTPILQVTEFVSVADLASLMDISATEVITTCMKVGVFVSINQRLDAEMIELVGSEFGFDVQFISAEEITEVEVEEEDAPEDLKPRAPIVTVMGHVDHGKTSLLDYIRKATVASGEAGGITQHIGAYEVVTKDGAKITFLDTPGHEAFTAMRARGAKVTDIAIIVIAADDSIMPQTREAISHAQAASVPMVFAINKIDKEGAKPERIKEELSKMNILVEEWGGSYQSQDISAKKGLNIDLLLEKVLLQAEMLELKANPNRLAIGAVLEASLDKGRGFVAKTLIQTGTLRIGDPMIAGAFSGKVKALFDEHGKRVKEAGPSEPVLVVGLSGAPQAGEKIKVMASEQEARALASKRAQLNREQEIRATKRITLKDIGRRLALGSFKQLNLIIKGDVDGSVEALTDSMLKLSTETVQVNVVHRAVGQVTESDVLLASASDAIVIGFNVRPSTNARKLAEQEGVEIKYYSIIYQAIEEIKLAIEGMLEPTKEEKIVCQVEIRDVFTISKVGTVAGCYVTEGKITRSNTFIRIIRDGIVVFPVKEGQQGELSSLKRFKDDVKEVKAGFECGLTIKGYNEMKVGDVVEGYEIVEVKQKLG